ncbi:permease-like cell division protein FtsX [Neisseriaceae bacterium B1]
MKHYLSLHWESCRRAAIYFFRQPIATLLILTMLAIAMTLPLILYLGVQSSKTVLDKLSEVPQITVYMELNADANAAEEVRKLLASDGRVQTSQFVGKDQGLAEMQEAMGAQDIVSMLDENPLPDVYIVTPVSNNPTEISKLQSDLSHYPMVESTQMDKEWMQTLWQFNQLIQRIFWFLAITLGVAFVLVAHNTIRLQILSHKEEIEITKLLGAPSSFVRRPFLYQAAWQSLLSAGISLALAQWAMKATQPLVNQMFQPYGLNLQWRGFYVWETASVLIVVVLLGIGGAWIATQQHLLSFKAKR